MPRKGCRRVREFSCSNTQILMNRFVATPTRSAFLTRHARNRTKVDQRSVSGKSQTRWLPFGTKTNVQIRKFSSWNKLAKPGELEYYTKQRYTQGTKCWNGPQRSVEVVVLISSFASLLTTLQLILSCGTENTLLTVAELEKCEYQITGTSPALCRPLEDENRRDEL